MKTAYTFYIENKEGKQITLAKVADASSAVQLLSWYTRLYASSLEWQCFIKQSRKPATPVEFTQL